MVTWCWCGLLAHWEKWLVGCSYRSTLAMPNFNRTPWCVISCNNSFHNEKRKLMLGVIFLRMNAIYTHNNLSSWPVYTMLFFLCKCMAEAQVYIYVYTMFIQCWWSNANQSVGSYNKTCWRHYSISVGDKTDNKLIGLKSCESVCVLRKHLLVWRLSLANVLNWTVYCTMNV
jgi:hypothetical protein